MSNALDHLQNKLAEQPVQTETAPETVTENATEVIQEQTVEQPAEQAEPSTEELQPQETVAEINNEPTVEQEAPRKKYANEQVAELNNFLERNPDKTIEDYQRLKRPADALGEEELLKQYLSEKEGMTEKEILLEMKKMEVKAKGEGDDFDFEDGDDESRLEAEAKRERSLRDARAWYGENQQKLFDGLSADNPNEDAVQSNDLAAQIRNQILDEGKKYHETAKENYYTQTYQALSEISDLTVPVLGDNVSFSPDDNFKKALREGLDVEKSLSKYYDENGGVKDAKNLVKEMAWYHEPTRNVLIDFLNNQAYERGKADALKNRKNITLNSRVPVSGNNTDDGTKAAVDAFIKNQYRNL